MTSVFGFRRHSPRPVGSRLRGMGRLVIVGILLAMGAVFYIQSNAEGGGKLAGLMNLDALEKTLAEGWADARTATADALERLAEAVRPAKPADNPS